MSGTPSESELQAQWRAAVDLLENARNFADGTVAGPGNLLDTLLQSVEGEYTPQGLTTAAQRFRGALSSLVEPGRVLEFLSPILFEYGRLITSGNGYADVRTIKRALYEHFVANSLTVKSRGITFDTTATLGAGNIGNGAVERLTVDENGFPLESCHVETKTWRCRQDRNSGVQEHAEVFEVVGRAAGPDGLLRASFGSGDGSRRLVRSAHAGSIAGGSLLKNASFSTYNASATPKFTGWTQTAGGASIVQETAAFYRGFPGSTVDASLRINGGGGTVTLTQTLDDMRVSRLEPDVPYFLRVMLNKTVGTAVGGTVTIRMGSQSASVTIAAMGSGWVELMIPAGAGCWFRTFNENPFQIEIEWSSSTSGYLLVDDVLFVPWDLVDGTYWVMRQNGATPVSWLVDDTLEFTDTGGSPATGKIQWWLWLAGLGYLPSTGGSPTFTDP